MYTYTERKGEGQIGLGSGLAPETSEPGALMARQFLMFFFLLYTYCMCSFSGMLKLA